MKKEDIINAISSFTNKGNLYLICKITEKTGFFTSDNHLIYLSIDDSNLSYQSIKTEHLDLQTHIKIQSVSNDASFKNGYYNCIRLTSDLQDSNTDSFIYLCEVYSKNNSELSFEEFFNSLINLFQLPQEQRTKNAIGLYGELKLIQQIYKDYKVDLSEFWHKKGSYTKYDFITQCYNFEIKTITNEDMIVPIKHNQLFASDNNILVVTGIELDSDGEALSDLINEMQLSTHYCNGINFNLNLAEELTRLSASDINAKRFKHKYTKFFIAKSINPFSNIPVDISGLEYRYDVSDKSSLTAIETKEIISNV